MAVNPFRFMLYTFGILLVVAALGIFFLQSGLDRWIPTSMLVAGVLLIVGLAIMSFADHAPVEASHHHHERRGGHRGEHAEEEGDVTVINR